MLFFIFQAANRFFLEKSLLKTSFPLALLCYHNFFALINIPPELAGYLPRDKRYVKNLSKKLRLISGSGCKDKCKHFKLPNPNATFFKDLSVYFLKILYINILQKRNVCFSTLSANQIYSFFNFQIFIAPKLNYPSYTIPIIIWQEIHRRRRLQWLYFWIKETDLRLCLLLNIFKIFYIGK